jgi:hypothetical protein
MSTRATYQFISEWSGTHTVYIHHDGYPEGAAEYFTKENGAPIVKVETFLRSNEKAELTKSHEIHGDSEFRYTVKSGTCWRKSALVSPINLILFGTEALLILSKNIVYQRAPNHTTGLRPLNLNF